jgi:hypothetical protein
MQILSPEFMASLQAARDGSIAPIHFVWVRAKNFSGVEQTMGLWSGDEDINVGVQTPTGGTASRSYLGGCNLQVSEMQFVADLTDNPVTVSMSQIAPAAQQLARGYDLRMAYCEIHATSWNGGALSSVPQLQWVGIIDEGPIGTPDYGKDGGISLTVRSDLMAQLTASNPAKSSDSHQQRRQTGDRFSRYSGVISSRRVQWWRD